MIKLFAGYDPREAVGFHAFVQSVIENASEPVSIIPVLDNQEDGTNAFTYARFRMQQLCDSGKAIFMDACDMLCVGDIAELWKLADPKYAVQVVKHEYQTKHQRKYVGTEMEADNRDYPRKNWSSVMIWNRNHWSNVRAAKELKENDGAFLHRFAWLEDSEIGELPVEWNWLADEYGANTKAKLLHWTAGQPGFYHYKDSPHSEEWRASVRKVLKGMD